MTLSAKLLSRVTAVIAVIAVLAAAVVLFMPGEGDKTLTAVYPRTVALYEGSDVKILGIPVGTVDSVTPEGTKVVVKMSYDGKYTLPADAKAVIISPSIVGDRFVQLTPVYKGGKALGDGAELPESRTATPLELDQIFSSLDSLNQALGPNGANRPDDSGVGALSRILDTTARNFGGQGVQFNQTLTNLGKFTKTLADNKEELFSSADQLERFIGTLAKNDTTVRRFNDSLAAGADLLADERQDLAATLKNLGIALGEVKGFVRTNKSLLTSNIAKLNRLATTLVNRRSQLQETLSVAPAALNNLGLAYDANTGTLDTRSNQLVGLNNLLTNPVDTLCSLIGKPTLCAPGSPLKQALDQVAGAAAPVTGAVASGARGSSNRAAPLTTRRDTVHVVEPTDPTLAGLVSAR